MQEYPSASIKSREANKEAAKTEKKIEKVVTGVAKTRKKSEMRKFADIFSSEDVANVKSVVLSDILIPKVKDLFWAISTNVLSMFLYGESRPTDRRDSGHKVSYRSYYEKERDRFKDRDVARAGSGFDYDEILFDSYGDAELVLSEMEGVIESYGFVSVADFYDMADVSNHNYLANRYGWTNLASAKSVPVNGGYIIKLPKARPLDR